ncbi:TPA: DUF6036 family nucleotidyltransferase [Vibrio vulnificus]
MEGLFVGTPLSKAVFELFDGLEKLLTDKFDELPSGAVKAYVLGGCAVHIYTNARGSNDLDTEFEASKSLDIHTVILDLDEVYFTDPATGESSLYLDGNFNTAIASMASDYKERSIPLVSGENLLHVYLVSAVDVAVSKLSRLAADDMSDIIAMFKASRFTLAEFKEFAEDAVRYSENPEKLQKNVDHAIRSLEEVG